MTTSDCVICNDLGAQKSPLACKGAEGKGYDSLGYLLGTKSKYNTIGFERYSSSPCPQDR